jgi:putative ABC transport system permease protein
MWKGESRLPLLFLAAASCTLFIACANLAGLLLARNLKRRKEIAVRLSLGASCGLLVRQLLTENLILSILGGVAGLVVAFCAKGLFMTFYSYSYQTLDVSLDPIVLLLSGGLTLVTGIFFGLAPAIQASRPNFVGALKDDGLGVGGHRSKIRATLVTAQIALSMILLVCAGLLTRSLRNAYLNMGFHPEQILHVRLGVWKLGADPKKWRSFHEEVLRRLEVLPGVQSVCLARTIPIGEWSGPLPVSLPGRSVARPEDLLQVENNEITPRFFGTLRIPLIKGRDFTEQDDRRAPRVVIVNETLARMLWPELDPLGRILMIDDKEHQVVGVARNVHLRNIAEGQLPFLYLSYKQREKVNTRIFLRSLGDPRSMLPLVRREIAAVDSEVSIAEGMLLTEWLQGYFSYVQVLGNVLKYASLQGLFISAIGLYGVILLVASQRIREFGIRKALGAQESDVLKLVLKEGLWLSLLGAVLGIVAALVLTSVLSSFLYGITPTDPFTFASVSLLLFGVALLASYIPARRATKIDPMIALRHE